MALSEEILFKIIKISDLIAEKFEYVHWEEVGILTGLNEQISNFHRLFQSFHNGDADYPARVSKVLVMIVESDDSNYDLIEKYLVAKGFRDPEVGVGDNVIQQLNEVAGMLRPFQGTFNREYFTKLCFENRKQLTLINCPFCNVGRLRVVKGTVHKIGGKFLEDINGDQMTFTFSLLLACNDESCKKSVAAGGESFVERLPVDWGGETKDFEYFYPKWFYPNINLFGIPCMCPKEVRECLKRSFAAFFNDPVAAGIHLRMALERLMDHFKVSTDKETKKGKVVRLNLHERIEVFSKFEEDIASNLLALKWLGNDAGHEGSLIKEDVLDGYEIIEYVLEELFTRRKRKEMVAMRSTGLMDKFDPKRSDG